jgi:hypothetical protein
MPTTLEVMRPHPAQRAILGCATRYRVVACGRRFGKTALGVMTISEAALRGELCWWLAPTYAMASDVWRELRRTLEPVQTEVSAADRRIGVRGGGSVAVRSTHTPDNLRGAGLDFAVLDEAAFMEPSVWPEVVRPMLLERRGRALFLSTPYGHNSFWRLFQLGTDPTVPDWAAFQHPSTDNPAVDPDELASIRAQTSERVFRSEYLAQFVADAGQVFRGIEAAATAPYRAEPQPGHRYVMGVDWGRDGDFTALAVVDANTAQMVALDRFNMIGYGLQRERLRALAGHWGVTDIWAEANSVGAVNIEELQREGLPVRAFTTTHRSKGPLIEGLAVAVERGDLALLPDPVLLGELGAYTIERLSGGGFRYSAPAGGHDDTVIATALAWYAVGQGGALVSFA